MGSFKDVVGHRDIINYIGNAVAMDQVSHKYAYLRKRVRDLVMNAIPVNRRIAVIILISYALRMISRIPSVWMTSECR